VLLRLSNGCYFQSNQSVIETIYMTSNAEYAPSFQSNQSGIETYFGIIVHCNLIASNRTKVELKLPERKMIGPSAALPIEPKWN